eukprot:COSAG02_NODE_3733_length_6312_cov_3.880251_5_plen_105_part_00
MRTHAEPSFSSAGLISSCLDVVEHTNNVPPLVLSQELSSVFGCVSMATELVNYLLLPTPPLFLPLSNADQHCVLARWAGRRSAIKLHRLIKTLIANLYGSICIY